MPEFKRILFPVDFSPASGAIQPLVVETARHFGASLSLLHVVYNPAAWYGTMEAIPPPSLTVDEEEMRVAAERQLASYCEGFEAPSIERIVKIGDPAWEIATFAREREMDVIMMPTHGTGKFRALLLGSVTAKVLHDADCAVWTDAHAEALDADRAAKPQSILCAVDIAPESPDLIRYANELADNYGAKLRLVHAVRAIEAHAEHSRYTDFRRALMEWSRERIAGLQCAAQTDLEVCLEGGNPASVVRDAAMHHEADLIVIGRGREQKTFGSLRSNAYAIICEATCPVLRR